MVWRGTPSFELNAESKETKLQKAQVVRSACIVYNLNFFFLTEKHEGSRRGSRRGVQVLSTPKANKLQQMESMLVCIIICKF